jgi:hypothetical protein
MSAKCFRKVGRWDDGRMGGLEDDDWMIHPIRIPGAPHAPPPPEAAVAPRHAAESESAEVYSSGDPLLSAGKRKAKADVYGRNIRQWTP